VVRHRRRTEGMVDQAGRDELFAAGEDRSGAKSETAQTAGVME
jgi:hypothetical protein